MEGVAKASGSLSVTPVASSFHRFSSVPRHLQLLKCPFQVDPLLASLSFVHAPPEPNTVLYVRMGLHPDWRQIDNKIRRMEYRIADFRILSNDLRISRGKLDSNDPEVNKQKLLEHIKQREEEVVAERVAIQTEMEKLTVYFHKGAQKEYVALRKFFLSYLYHTTRNAMEHLKPSEFERLLWESPEGVTYELPDRGTVSFAPRLCMIIAAGQKLSVSSVGIDTTPLAIALAIIQAGSSKHCDNPNCRKEECHVLKADYEALYEAFFKRKVRALINQKARGEMPAVYDTHLKIHRSTVIESADSKAPLVGNKL